jgi:PPK2 family polyphosphate:nucleotide phosphotransferase
VLPGRIRENATGCGEPAGKNPCLWRMPEQPVVVRNKIKLSHFDPAYCAGRDKDETKRATRKFGKRIAELQELLYANSDRAVLLLFQGLDASGKDGAIRKVLHYVNPAGVETAAFKVPSAVESAHDFLWRVHHAVPRYGNIGVFNRSQYEAVLAERVLGRLPRAVCRQRYRRIVEFEEMLVENRVVVLKFFLHLSRDEQAERFRERLELPEKRWKFSSGDLDTRRHWKTYMEAYEDMLNATSHPAARWHLVPADRNWYRNYVVSRTVAEAMNALNLKWPKPKEDLSKIRIT